MEEILTGLCRDATSSQSKAIYDACSWANDELLLCRSGTKWPAPYQLREKCFLPLRLALESRSSKLSLQAVNGLQKLISDERFRSNGGEEVENQLPVQFINAVVSTPSLSDEVQVEIMKLLLIITCSASCEVHGEYLIKIAEICMDTYTRSHQSSTKTACRATLTQMLSSICQRLQDSLTRGEPSKSFLSGEKMARPSHPSVTGYSKVLSQDVVVLLKHFCLRLTTGPSSVQPNHAVPLHLEAMFVMLSSLPAALQENKDFLNAIWQLLCPALIQLLGSPVIDVNTRTKSPSGYSEDMNRAGRGSGSFGKASPAVGPVARTIYNIAAELLRLVGPLASMRPVLESLFHRIILYPPPNQRAEALKSLKEVLASPQRLLDAAGPTIIDKDNPPSPDSPTEQKKSELDLLRLLMDGIVESAHCLDNMVASCSVACVVALLGSLEDLSLGRGLSDEHVEFLSKMKEEHNWEEVYDGKGKYENAASARDVPKFTVADVMFDGEERFNKGKRSPEGDINSLTERFERNGQSWGPQENGIEEREEEFDIRPLQPKSVHFAAEDEITMFEAHENENSRTNRGSFPQRNGGVRRSNLPRRLGTGPHAGARTTVRRSSSLDGKSRQKPNIVQRRNLVDDARGKQRMRNSAEPTRIPNFDAKSQGENPNTTRSFSDIDVPNKKSQISGFPLLPLRKSNSWTKLSSVDTNESRSGESMSSASLQSSETGSGDNKTRVRISSDSTWIKTDTISISKEGNSLGEESKLADPVLHKANDSPIKVHKVESKANKLEAREKAEKASPTKGSRPNIRRTRSASEFDQKQLEARAGKQRGTLAKAQSLDEPDEIKQKRNIASQVRINGIYVNRRGQLGSPNGSELSVENRHVVEVKKGVQDNEKEGARNFARCLLGILPAVLSLTDSVAVDESLQQFSSDVCEAVTCMALQRKNVPNFGTLRGRSDLVDEKSGQGATSDPHYPILNADGVYVTVYATLALNLKLLKSNYYQRKTNDLPMTQKDFVSSIIESGVAVGLSSVWLGELYRLVTTYNILGKAGYTVDNPTANRALIGLLSHNALSSERETKDEALLRHVLPDDPLPAKREGVRFARRVLLTTWDSVLEILSLPLETSVTGGTNGMSLMLGGESKRDHNRERDTICLSLDGLRRAARLCCSLGIQMRCEMVLAQLADASCGSEGLGANRRKQQGGHGPSKLHAAHVLSMDGLLAVGVELGIHAPKCWQHVFRCCTYISELERTHFHFGVVNPTRPLPPNSLRVNSDVSPMSESSSISDCFSGEVSPNGSDISRKVNENGAEPTSVNGGLLSLADASRAIYALSAAVDRLFEYAANTLTLEGLLSFLRALVSASQAQLFPRNTEIFSGLSPSAPAYTTGPVPTYSGTLHLYRLADVMLRSARNASRPLLHLMKAWHLISPHFVEAATHKDQHISNLAITSLHDVITEMLNSRSELPHFWFHEALFKPFEQIASSERCTEEKQEWLLATVCSLIDPYVSSVKSGWRSVFAFVMAIRISERVCLEAPLQTDHRLTQILGIFSSFMSNKNPAVFASAAVQCIHTLLRFVNSSGYDDVNDDGSRSDIDSASNMSDITMVEMSLPALEFLSNFSKKLASVYIMPSSLVFHGSHSVSLAKLENAHSLPSTPEPSPNSSPAKQNGSLSSHRNSDFQTVFRDSAQSIIAIDDTGVLRVWFLLLEGLTNAVAQCPRRFQPQTLEILFDILRSITTVPGPNFSVYTVSHLLLPMLQAWVERGNRDRSYWEGTAANFKHACGLATELIVEELGQFLSVEGAAECVPGVIKQILDLLTECVKQPVEKIARLGCSCLRHLLLAGGPVFTEDLWHIVCQGLKEAIQTTLSNMKQMVTCFQPGSYNVSGDEGMSVRVVARRDSTASDLTRLQQVAEQVLLLDNQMESCSLRKTEIQEPASDEEEQRSYVFVLSTVESKEKPEAARRIPLRGLLVSLLSHQLLLKTLSSILLDQHENSFSTSGPVPNSPAISADSVGTERSEVSLPGLLSYLSPANISVLFDCLMESHMVAYEFNARPGLRFLIQKLSRLEAPANLLRQSADAFTCYLHTLFQICAHGGDHFSSSHIKRILTGERVNNHENEDTTKADVVPSPCRHNDLLKGDRNVDWIIRRLNEACDQLSSVYLRLLSQYTSESQENELDRSFSISATFSPSLDLPLWSQADDSLSSPLSRKRGASPEHRVDAGHREGRAKHSLEEELRLIEHEKQLIRRKEDELLQLGIWTHLVTTMLELLLGLPTLQFKAVLPAVFPTVTSLIATGTEPKVRQLVCDVIKRMGSIYGIV